MTRYRTLLADAPQPVIDQFKRYTEGAFDWSELRDRIDRIAETDSAVLKFRRERLSALDRPNEDDTPF